MASARRTLHTQPGLATMAIVPAIFLVQVTIVPTTYTDYWELAKSAIPANEGSETELLWILEGTLLTQIDIAFLFPALIALLIYPDYPKTVIG
ncbi:hypothetical protein E2F43_15645 [Seongchinamella unica]|uniref:Uncharacterized protein n=1 Tax=Seongchinamella unica TaxID=2547392 RepID=A0A4R5LNB0_9GAMM|nr:hypothetical protein [Seongchinamella unica]TDG11804.1 hypothetical protein E2F43_15645 [Seongchinamella unica]